MTIQDHLLPAWLKNYPRENLGADVIAGLVVTVLVLPQSLAYAMLAGLPPQAGLYVSILPVIAYAWVGSSMTQAVGPVAITAIMTYALLSPLAEPGSPQYIALAAALALFTGALVLVFGLLRLGYLASLLSRPVVSGFISGSALLILLSQLRLLLGVPAQGADTLAQLNSLVAHLGATNPVTLIIGGLGVATLLVAKNGLGKVLQRFGLARPQAELAARLMPLILVAGASLAVVWLDLDGAHGVAVVGSVRGGLPDFGLDIAGFSALGVLAGPALALAFISTVQNITMAQALAIKRHERIDANRELIGLGLSNLVASVAGGMPVGGGTSRSAVNVASGARSPLASIVSAVFMLCLVLIGTSWFERIPLAILAASIIVAAISMIDVAELRRAWSYDRADAGAYLGTALGVVVLGLQAGIVLGVALSLVTFLYRASTPHIAVVGRIPGTEHFRNVERHGVEVLPGVLFLRIDESIFFGNFRAVELRLVNELSRMPDARHVVLIMSAVNRVDLTALEALSEVRRDLQGRGIALHLAEVKGPVQDRLVHTDLWTHLSGHVYLSVNEAFEKLK